MQKSKVIHFLYHSLCFDGFGAYYYFRKKMEEMRMSEADYVVLYKEIGYDPKSLSFFKTPQAFRRGSLAVFADYCPPIEVLHDLKMEKGCTVLILDHHKTAESVCEGVRNFPEHESLPNFNRLLDLHLNREQPEIYKVFDMNRSGAGIVYDFLYGTPGNKRPPLVNFLEDRDLWKFDIHMSKEVNAFIQSRNFDYDEWKRLESTLSAPLGFANASYAGAAILRETEHTVKTIIKGKVKIVDITIGSCAFVNLSSHWSEVGATVLSDYPEVAAYIGLTYNFEDQTIQFSFRSRQGSEVDVSKVAKDLGGGGHKHAAGVILPIKEANEWLTKVGVLE